MSPFVAAIDWTMSIIATVILIVVVNVVLYLVQKRKK
jgi:hypothetical protein